MEKEIEYMKIPLFEGISEENLKKLLYCINSFKREYEKGETIILEKDKVPYIGIVLYGSVHMLKNDIWGNSTLLSYVTEGELFGENFAATIPVYLAWVILNITPKAFSIPKIIYRLIVIQRLDDIQTSIYKYSFAQRIIVLFLAIIVFTVGYNCKRGRRKTL